MSISTICVMAAMTEMKETKIKKLKSILLKFAPSQCNAALAKKKCLNAQAAGVQIVKTKMTAAPKPTAVSIFFEQAIYEQFPRKKASKMFSTNIALTARLT